MGLSTTHGCYNGSYTYFGAWRHEIARAVGVDLWKMKGYAAKGVQKKPLSWDVLGNDVIRVLLDHPDNTGHINWKHTEKLADRLEELLPSIKNYPPENDFKAVTKKFIEGLRLAHEKHEKVLFG
jgi:hypothetical protein